MTDQEADTWMQNLAVPLTWGRFCFTHGLSPSFCQNTIKAWANQLSRCPSLEEAERRVAESRFDCGDYRDLRHLLHTETRAALQAVERRHFETSFTTC